MTLTNIGEYVANPDLLSADEEILKKYSVGSRKAPPRPGSDEEKLFTEALARQRIRRIQLGRHTTEQDLEAVLSTNSIDAGERARLGLQISSQLRKNKKSKLFKFWTGWVVFFLLLGGLIGGGYYYAMTNMEGGRYKVPFTCKLSFGESELEGRRHLSFPFKTLSGWQWTSPWANIDEEVEVVLKGDPLIIVGVDDKGKTWRKEYNKGEFGVAKLPKSSSYWLIGKNFKETALVQHSDFCK